MMPKIYILLPVHNRKHVTERFIDCLVAQTFQNYHLVLIDDGSEDGTDEMVKAKISCLTVIRGEGDWWWAGSLQQGIDFLFQLEVKGSDIVVFANDDITFEEDFLLKAAEILESLDSTLLLPYLRDENPGLPQETGVEANLKKFTFERVNTADKTNCLPTRGLFMRVADLRKIGAFHPKLLPHYWSDYEFTMRAYKKGLALMTSPDLVISLDHTQTGFHSFREANFFSFITQYFSKKSVLNPVYTSIFIILTSPLLFVPVNLIKIWARSFIYIAKQLKRTLSGWVVGVLVLNAISNSKDNLRIIIGSASTKQEKWISTDYPVLDLTDDRTFAKLFAPDSVKNFLAEHVFEHLILEDRFIGYLNCFRFLKKKGVLRIAVPDGFHPDPDYIAQVKPGGYGLGSDDHKVLYNYQSLSAELKKAGFYVKLLEWFDEKGEFHYQKWSVENGMIVRSTRFDQRNKINPRAYTSLIIDAIKP